MPFFGVHSDPIASILVVFPVLVLFCSAVRLGSLFWQPAYDPHPNQPLLVRACGDGTGGGGLPPHCHRLCAAWHASSGVGCGPPHERTRSPHSPFEQRGKRGGKGRGPLGDEPRPPPGSLRVESAGDPRAERQRIASSASNRIVAPTPLPVCNVLCHCLC